MLTFVGLGLWSGKDVSLAGLEAIREADAVFAEWYTARLGGASTAELETLYGKPVRVLSREDVEDGDLILAAAREGRACFLAAGDAMTATTHVDLRVRAERDGIPTRVVFGPSIWTAASALCGLQPYKFGRATTIVFPEGNYFPTSPYDVVRDNRARGLHTLCLLDLRAGGSAHENRPGTETRERYMTAAEGADLLLRMEREREEDVLSEDTVGVAIARAGAPDARVVAGSLSAVAKVDVGPPLHTLIVPGSLHFSEEEALGALAEST